MSGGRAPDDRPPVQGPSRESVDTGTDLPHAVEGAESEPTQRPEPPPPAGRRLRFRLKTAAEVAALVSAAAAVIALPYTVLRTDDGADVTRDQPPPSATDGVTTPEATPSGGVRLQVGTCLADAPSPSVVGCETTHSHEVFSLDDCSDEALVRYLGGQPGMELLRTSAARVSVDGQQVCAFSDPATGGSVRSAAGVLQSEDHDRWRRCHDARTQEEVPCSAEHTGELLPLVSGPDGAADCTAAAERYVGTSRRTFGERLQVVTLRQSDGPQCVIATRGRDLLDGSVRGLGARSLPLVQG